MTNRKADLSATGDYERRVIAFAERLGWIVGAAQAKTEGWLADAQLRERLTEIRDGASDLLARLDTALSAVTKPPHATGTMKTTSPSPQSTVNEVHAPGKRHRQPPRTQRSVPHSNQQVAKAKMASMRRSRGRG